MHRRQRFCYANCSLSSSCNAPKPCHSEEAQGADVGISCINVSTNRKPINMEYPNDSMLIKLYMIIPSCWRLPRRHFMPPRNDMETGWLAALKMVRNVSKNTVIANQCAHWCGDRRECLWCNLPEISARSDHRGDCHVASLLAMTEKLILRRTAVLPRSGSGPCPRYRRCRPDDPAHGRSSGQ